jgi:ubiquitin-conjugating enzyme E2 J2
MITPSGRFQTSTRLCLSISDFHPKSFNPAWEVSTILIGLLSFMTSEEMTTGSISASERERKVLAQSSRWWNSTGGGSAIRREDGTIVHAGTVVPGRKVGLGDAGKRFRSEWPDEDAENWKWIAAMKLDPLTGSMLLPTEAKRAAEAEVLRRRVPQAVLGSGGPAANGAAVVARGEGWLRRHRLAVGLAVVVAYVLLARAFE